MVTVRERNKKGSYVIHYTTENETKRIYIDTEEGYISILKNEDIQNIGMPCLKLKADSKERFSINFYSFKDTVIFDWDMFMLKFDLYNGIIELIEYRIDEIKENCIFTYEL